MSNIKIHHFKFSLSKMIRLKRMLFSPQRNQLMKCAAVIIPLAILSIIVSQFYFLIEPSQTTEELDDFLQDFDMFRRTKSVTSAPVFSSRKITKSTREKSQSDAPASAASSSDGPSSIGNLVSYISSWFESSSKKGSEAGNTGREEPAWDDDEARQLLMGAPKAMDDFMSDVFSPQESPNRPSGREPIHVNKAVSKVAPPRPVAIAKEAVQPAAGAGGDARKVQIVQTDDADDDEAWALLNSAPKVELDDFGSVAADNIIPIVHVEPAVGKHNVDRPSAAETEYRPQEEPSPEEVQTDPHSNRKYHDFVSDLDDQFMAINDDVEPEVDSKKDYKPLTVAKKAPVAKTYTATKSQPAAMSPPFAGPAPVAKTAAVSKTTSMYKTARFSNTASVSKTAPVSKTASMYKTTRVSNTGPVSKTASMYKTIRVSNTAPVSKTASMYKTTRVSNTAPASSTVHKTSSLSKTASVYTKSHASKPALTPKKPSQSTSRVAGSNPAGPVSGGKIQPIERPSDEDFRSHRIDRKLSDIAVRGGVVKVCSNQERVRTMRKACLTASPKYPDTILNKAENFGRFFVMHNTSTVYCGVQTTEKQSWHDIMYDILQKEPTAQVTWMNNDLKKAGIGFLSEYSVKKIREILRTYKKVLIVKHPMSRINSAYWMRVHEGPLWKIKAMKTLLTNLLNIPDVTNEITYQQYLKYVTHWNPPSLAKADKYWQPFHSMCFPCLIDYDVLVKYETLDVGEKKSTKEVSTVKTHRKLWKFGEADDTTVRKLAQVYESEMTMFGYDWDRQTYLASCGSYDTDQCC